LYPWKSDIRLNFNTLGQSPGTLQRWKFLIKKKKKSLPTRVLENMKKTGEESENQRIQEKRQLSGPELEAWKAHLGLQILSK
jgi:hypothetical protein